MSSLVRALSCGTIGGKKRTNAPYSKSNTNPDGSETGNFWDIDGYETVLERLNNGNQICNDLIEIIEDRASVEENYSKALKNWEKKWSEYLASNKCKEYQSSKEACYALLRTGTKTAEFHSALNKRLIDKNASPIADIREWLRKNYQKAHIHFKKRNEFDELFKDAQKQWIQYFKQLKKFEKDYHNAVKARILANEKANQAQKNPNKTEEERKEAKQEVELAAVDEKTALKNYEDHFNSMEPFKTDYKHDMIRVFDRAQEFEKLRINFVKSVYDSYYKCFADHINDPKYKELFKEFIEKTNSIKPEEDLKWWSNNYGSEMVPNWPTKNIEKN